MQLSVPSSLTIGNGEGGALIITLDTPSALQTFALQLAYDPAVVFPTAVGTTSLTSGCTLTSDFSTSGLLVISGICTAPITRTGPFLTVSVTARGTCGASSEVSISSCSLNRGLTPCASNPGELDVSCSISGRVTYYSNAQPIQAAVLRLAGSTPATVSTDSAGQFTLSGLDAGPWILQPLKGGDTASAISALDAVYVLQSVVQLRTLTPQQQRACDVTGDGTVSALDATLILQHAVGLITSFPVAQACGSDWAFEPAAAPATHQQITQPQTTAGACQLGGIGWSALATSVTGQDFSAIVFGDCTGNWQPSTAAPARAAFPASAGVHLGRKRHVPHSGLVRIPLYVDASLGFRALEVELHYDPRRVKPAGVRRMRSTHGALLEAQAPQAGVLKLALASAHRLRGGAGVMLQFEFAQGNATPSITVVNAQVATD